MMHTVPTPSSQCFSAFPRHCGSLQVKIPNVINIIQNNDILLNDIQIFQKKSVIFNFIIINIFREFSFPEPF